ncbi:hypothetical protein KM043_000857 [Ampulex compressa]|nr:hypothetical protein KM043_000857 [Ampulex compressa]
MASWPPKGEDAPRWPRSPVDVEEPSLSPLPHSRRAPEKADKCLSADPKYPSTMTSPATCRSAQPCPRVSICLRGFLSAWTPRIEGKPIPTRSPATILLRPPLIPTRNRGFHASPRLVRKGGGQRTPFSPSLDRRASRAAVPIRFARIARHLADLGIFARSRHEASRATHEMDGARARCPRFLASIVIAWRVHRRILEFPSTFLRRLASVYQGRQVCTVLVEEKEGLECLARAGPTSRSGSSYEGASSGAPNVPWEKSWEIKSSPGPRLGPGSTLGTNPVVLGRGSNRRRTSGRGKTILGRSVYSTRVDREEGAPVKLPGQFVGGRKCRLHRSEINERIIAGRNLRR